ncbi:hypothetical protein L7F22_031836 [Adiantum nelumboides]|nr:hypothetical protein [Adiantum nelumboides]
MEENNLNVSTGGHFLPGPRQESSSFDNFAFSPDFLKCSTPDASNVSIVFNNILHDGNTVDLELACRDDGSYECWDEQRKPHDGAMVQVGWNASNFSLKKGISSVIPSRNLAVLFQHALRQGLTFKLRGLLGDMLGCTVNSTKVLLASSKLANSARAGTEHTHTIHKNRSVRGPKFDLLKSRDGADLKTQNLTAECVVKVMDKNALSVEAQDHASPKALFGTSAEGQVAEGKLPSTLGSSSITSTHCQYQGHEEEVLNKTSEITPNNTSFAHRSDDSDLKIVLSTKETNGSCAEISQECSNLTNQIRAENLEEHAPAKLSQTNSSRSYSESETRLPNCNFSTWSGQNSNVPFPGHNLNTHKEWHHHFAKHQQVPEGPLEWPKHDCMDRSVKPCFSASYFPQNIRHFWSPSPASGYQCTSDKCLNTHADYVTCQMNPLAQSCPSFARSLSHSQCQHSSRRQCLMNKCSLLFPKQGKPTGIGSCCTCQYCPEQFSRSARACGAESELGMRYYQCPPSFVLNNCFQHLPECFDDPTFSDHSHAMKCGGTPSRLKPTKLLWLSEEEAEIIRLIRLSQVKDFAESKCLLTEEEDLPIHGDFEVLTVDDTETLNQSWMPHQTHNLKDKTEANDRDLHAVCNKTQEADIVKEQRSSGTQLTNLSSLPFLESHETRSITAIGRGPAMLPPIGTSNGTPSSVAHIQALSQVTVSIGTIGPAPSTVVHHMGLTSATTTPIAPSTSTPVSLHLAQHDNCPHFMSHADKLLTMDQSAFQAITDALHSLQGIPKMHVVTYESMYGEEHIGVFTSISVPPDLGFNSILPRCPVGGSSIYTPSTAAPPIIPSSTPIQPNPTLYSSHFGAYPGYHMPLPIVQAQVYEVLSNHINPTSSGLGTQMCTKQVLLQQTLQRFLVQLLQQRLGTIGRQLGKKVSDLAKSSLDNAARSLNPSHTL